MSTDLEIPEISQISNSEEDFIIGGATLDPNIDTNNYQKTSLTQACNCGKFQGLNGPSNLCICDNCKWARITNENSTTTYCLKQQL